jgi:hypothetical protein
MTMMMKSERKKAGLQKRRHMVLHNGKELYEWEQSKKRVILRIPLSSVSSSSSSASSPRGGDGESKNNNDNIFCVITDNFVQLGCRNGDRLPPSWYLSHDTGGKVNATKSRWTTIDDDGICTITLYKQNHQVQDTIVWPVWRYALFDDRVDDVKTVLKRPKRTSATQSRSRSNGHSKDLDDNNNDNDNNKKVKRRSSSKHEHQGEQNTKKRASSKTRRRSSSKTSSAQSSRHVARHSLPLKQQQQHQSSRDILQSRISLASSSPNTPQRKVHQRQRRSEVQQELEQFQVDLTSKLMSVLPTKNNTNNKNNKKKLANTTNKTTTPTVRFGPDADYPKGRGPSTNERGVLDQVHHTPRSGGQHYHHHHQQQQHQPVVNTIPLANTIRELEQEWEQDKDMMVRMKDKKKRSSVRDFYQREWKDEEQPTPAPVEQKTTKPPVTNTTTKKTSPPFSKDLMSIEEINQVIQDEISKQQMATASEDSKFDDDYYYHNQLPATAAESTSSTTIVSSEMQVELEFDAGLRWANLLDHPAPAPAPRNKEESKALEDNGDFLHDLELSFSTWNCLLNA